MNTGSDILVTIGAQVCLHHKFEACFVEGSTSLKIVHVTQPRLGIVGSEAEVTIEFALDDAHLKPRASNHSAMTRVLY